MTQATDARERKIVWALDPSVAVSPEAPDRELEGKVVPVLRMLSGCRGCRVVPVSVLARDHSRALPGGKEGLERRLVAWLRGLDLPRVDSPRLLLESAFSLRGVAQALVREAERVGAELIAVGRHGREGVSRLLHGNFAEAVLFQSPLPVLSLDLRYPPAADFRYVLYPTDFSEASSRLFDRAVELTHDLGAELVIFHGLGYLPYYFDHVFPDVCPTVHPVWESESTRSEEGRRWQSRAEAAGVKAALLLRHLQGRAVADAILGVAESLERPLIAMASQTGPVVSALLGSVTRQLVRHATCPVLVMHPARP